MVTDQVGEMTECVDLFLIIYILHFFLRVRVLKGFI